MLQRCKPSRLVARPRCPLWHGRLNDCECAKRVFSQILYRYASLRRTSYIRCQSLPPLRNPRTRLAHTCLACAILLLYNTLVQQVGRRGAALGACACCPRTLARWRVRAQGSSSFQAADFTHNCRHRQGFLQRWCAAPRAAFWHGGHTRRELTAAPPRCSRLCGQPFCNVAASRSNLLV